VPAGAPLPAQLKAIDTEYHQLLDKGQSAKADHVQALFAWKSKMATQVFCDCFVIVLFSLLYAAEAFLLFFDSNTYLGICCLTIINFRYA